MSALLLWVGDRLYWFPEEAGNPKEYRIPGSPEQVVRILEAGEAAVVLPDLEATLRARSRDGVRATDPVSQRAIRAAGTEALPAVTDATRRARDRVPRSVWSALRPIVFAWAEHRLTATLGSPVEVVTTLAREEERVERALAREANAAEQWVSGAAPTLQQYKEDWDTHRKVLEAFHRRLRDRLEAETRKLSPNLSELVGPRVAARLISAAGGVASLARMSAGRLQLLGARRRPAAGRTPRFGIILRAEGMGSVPEWRQAAFARSLAALAVIAARADAMTGRNVEAPLRARKERRSRSLSRRSSP